ncbi:MAG: MFS transporter [Caldilineaceae bacterium]
MRCSFLMPPIGHDWSSSPSGACATVGADESFPNAVTWNTSLMQISGVLGPALGGLIVAINVPSAYVVTALTSLLFMIMLSVFAFALMVRAGTASVGTLLAGIRFVWNARILLTMISLDLFAVLLGGAVYLLPIYAEDILNVGATGFGWLRAAPAIGAFCMAILMVYMPPMKRAGWGLLLNVAGFGLATIVFGFSKSFWLSFFMLCLTGAFDNVSMVVRQTLQQLLTPDSMRGRVSAVTSVFVGASNELGGMESGLVAQWISPVFSVVSGGIGTILVVLITAFVAPELRNFGALHDTKPLDEGGGNEKRAFAKP